MNGWDWLQLVNTVALAAVIIAVFFYVRNKAKEDTETACCLMIVILLAIGLTAAALIGWGVYEIVTVVF